MDQGRRGHAAERGEERQERLLGRGQLADVEFAFELETDEKEENRHQSVVDPMFEAQAENRLVPEGDVGRTEGGVGDGD